MGTLQMNYTTKLIIVALLAFTVGGTCPSDVNNDGTVGINDFSDPAGRLGLRVASPLAWHQGNGERVAEAFGRQPA